jgi:hypothetical protein
VFILAVDGFEIAETGEEVAVEGAADLKASAFESMMGV